MKAKKVLTTALATAMVFSALPGTSVKAEVIEGSTIFVGQDVIDVTLPTTASQKFYIDPQGLVAVGKGGSATANAGTVTGASDMYAVNRSSIPLALSVSYKLIDSKTTGGVTVISTVGDDDIDGIQNDADKKIAVSVSAVESAADADAKDCGGHVFKEVAAGVDMTANSGMTTADAVYADKTAVSAAYLMTAETYKAQLKSGKTEADAYDSSAYEYVVDVAAKKASCVKFTIGGYCSTKADWSDYADGTESLKLDLVFKFKKVASDTGDYTDAKVGTDEIAVGPQVSLGTDGVIRVTNLDGTLWQSMSLNDGTQDWPLTTGTDGTWEWGDAKDAKKEFTLASNWMPSYLAGKTAKVTITLTDGSTIESAAVTFPVADAGD